MPVYNADVVEIFQQVADLLEIEGANQFRVRAYRNAARTIETLSGSVAEMVEQGEDLSQLDGIGEDLAGKIEEIVSTGGLQQLDEIQQRTPANLSEMLDISGLGPKRVEKIHHELGVDGLDGLREAAENGRIQQLDGLGPKTEAKILEDLESLDAEEQRTRLDVAEEMTEPLLEYLLEAPAVERAEVAGSYRRRKETVGDLDILVISDAGAEVIARFVDFEDVEKVISQGETRSSVMMRSDLQVDLRVVPAESYGAALLYFTGSKAHNIDLRDRALDRGYKVNEYGVFEQDQEEGDQVAGTSEEEIYQFFGLDFIVPELREDRGELKAAAEGKLPALLTLEDIRGDLQAHTTASDGRATLEEMARGAADRGYAYFAVTDHTSYLGVTQGMDGEEFLARNDQIDKLNERMSDIQLLKSAEIDIHEDGSLDLEDEVLKTFDLVLVSIHSHFGLSHQKQTRRILTALDNPHVHVLAHPTGRRINEREPYRYDLEKVITAARERGCFLEINAQPGRLDLKDTHCQLAKEMGLKLVISTDAHSVNELDVMRYGVDQARRGWLTADDVINTRSWPELKKLLQR